MYSQHCIQNIHTSLFQRAAQCGAPSDSTSARTADAGEVPLAPDAVRGRGAPSARSRALGGAWGAAPRAAPSAARRGGGAGLGGTGAGQCGALSDSTSARTADVGAIPLAPDAVRGRGAPAP